MYTYLLDFGTRDPLGKVRRPISITFLCLIIFSEKIVIRNINDIRLLKDGQPVITMTLTTRCDCAQIKRREIRTI